MSILNSPGERLKHIRKLLKLTRAEIAEKYGISPHTLKYWETPTVVISEKALNACVEIYRDEGMLFNREWVLTGIGLAPKSFAEIGKNFTKQQNIKSYDRNDDELLLLKEVKFFKELYLDGTLMVVPNNDMLPFYKAGDYVCGRWIFIDQISQAVNKDCIVQLITGGKFFRRLVQDANGLFNISCLNPMEAKNEPVIYNVQIESVAPIIWHRKILI